MLVSTSEINFKNIGFQGYLVRIEKPSALSAINYSGLVSSQIPSSQLLSPIPDSQDNRKPNTSKLLEIIDNTNSNRLNTPSADRRTFQQIAFSLKYDIENELYQGEILDGMPGYYDYMLSDRSKLKLESTKNLKISSRIDESILHSNRDDPLSSSINNNPMEDSKLPVHIIGNSLDTLSSKRSNAINESNLLKKFEAKFREEEVKVGGDPMIINKEKIDYAQGIRALQLYGNKLYDLDDLKKEMERSSDEDSKDNENDYHSGEKKDDKPENEKNSIQNEEEEEEDFDDNSSFFKNRKRFKNLVNHANEKRFLPNIKLNITGLLSMICFLIIGIVFEVYNLQGIDNIKRSYELIQASSQRLFLSQEILNRVFELQMLNKQVLTNTPTNYETKVRDKLTETIDLISQYHNYIIFNSFGFSPEHTALMYDKTTNVTFLDKTGYSSENFDINDATNQIIGKAYLISKENLSEITMGDPNTFFILYNLLNGCYRSAKNSLKLFIGDLVDMINKSQKILVYSIVVSVLLLFIGFLVLIYFFVKVSQHENHILSIFLEIPIPKAKYLFMKCEAFLTQLQQGNEDDDLLESEAMSDNSSDNNDNVLDSNKKNKKRKKVKISYVGLKGFILKLFFIVAAVEAFFIMKYYFYKTIFDNQMSIQSEVNSTLFANAMCGILVNSMRQRLFDPTILIESKEPSETIPIQLEQLSEVFTNLKRVFLSFNFLIVYIFNLKEHSINLNIHTPEYVDMFNRVMLQNSCILIEASNRVPYYPCPEIVLGGLQQVFEKI